MQNHQLLDTNPFHCRYLKGTEPTMTICFPTYGDGEPVLGLNETMHIQAHLDHYTSSWGDDM
jgi:hypothetical protein